MRNFLVLLALAAAFGVFLLFPEDRSAGLTFDRPVFGGGLVEPTPPEEPGDATKKEGDR